jgi:ribosomal protein S6
MGAVGAENRSYEMQIAQKYPEVDGVGPNARRLAYGIKRHSACRSTAFQQTLPSPHAHTISPALTNNIDLLRFWWLKHEREEVETKAVIQTFDSHVFAHYSSQLSPMV